MKLRRTLALIMVAAMLCFVGIGFAAWTFTNIESAQVSTIEDRVAVGIELNDGFELYNAADNTVISTLYLICDAPSGETGILNGQGVYWSTSVTGKDGSGNKLAVTNVYIKGTLAKADEDGVWDKATVDVAFTADYSDLSSTYITFGTAPTIASTTGITVVDDAIVQSATFILPTVAYVTANLPHSITELTAMNTALGTALTGTALRFTAQIIA